MHWEIYKVEDDEHKEKVKAMVAFVVDLKSHSSKSFNLLLLFF